MSAPETAVDVAIVGGGASGALLAIHLLRSSAASIALIDREERIARGAAYGTRRPEHLLNVPVAKMSALAAEPDHFLSWMRARRPQTRAEEFAARVDYGNYLQQTLEEAAASSRGRLRVVRGEARDVDGGVLLGDGRRIEAELKVLALGNAAPDPLPVPDGGLYRSPWYVASPWSAEWLARITEDDDVLLIGTGLTMVDAVLSLEGAAHRARIFALSRHGLLPRPHGPSGGVAFEPPRGSVRAGLRALRRAIRSAGEERWRSFFDALRPATPALWRALGVQQQARFLRHLRTHWDVHRHRIPVEAAQTLARLEAERRLTLLAGRIRSFALDPSGIDVTLRRRGRSDVEILRVRHVINCTGPAPLSTSRAPPILRTLFERGAAVPDVHGMGVRTSDEGALVERSGAVSSSLYALGPLRRGELWESTAVPEIRAQAAALAQVLAKRLGR